MTEAKTNQEILQGMLNEMALLDRAQLSREINKLNKLVAFYRKVRDLIPEPITPDPQPEVPKDQRSMRRR